MVTDILLESATISILLTHYHTVPHFDTLKIYGGGKHSEHVTMFSTLCTLKCRLQFVSIWTSLKFCHLVMG